MTNNYWRVGNDSAVFRVKVISEPGIWLQFVLNAMIF